MIVVDASVAVAWSFEDERKPAIDDVLKLVGAEGGVVPSVWLIEAANTFRTAMRKGRITPNFRDHILLELQKLPITIEADTRQTIVATVAVSDRFGLTVYDAAYLEIALRLKLP
ncbi:MAG: type II toxin-antitoxin system VapC family toxin [Devosia sp.]